jgi:hypothetical protein
MAVLTILGALASIGTSIGKWYTNKKRNEAAAAKANQLSQLLIENQINVKKYLEELDKMTAVHKEEIKRDLGRQFKRVGNQISRQLRQRRIDPVSGIGGAFRKSIGRGQAETLSTALRKIEEQGLKAKLEAEREGQRQAQALASGLMGVESFAEGLKAKESAFGDLLAPLVQTGTKGLFDLFQKEAGTVPGVGGVTRPLEQGEVLK